MRAPSSFPLAIMAATIRFVAFRPGRWRSPARTTTMPSTRHRFPTGAAFATRVTHLNLNDQVVEGIRCERLPAFGVQYHPEAGPGPHDARYLFEEFRVLMEGSA